MRRPGFSYNQSIGSWASAVLFSGIAATAAFGQAAPAEGPLLKMPGNPVELLKLAASANDNDLEMQDVKPWHLKVSFQALDEQGAVTDHGTIEEFWAGPHKYKVIYQHADSSQQEYGTDKGRFSSGAPRSTLQPLGLIYDEMVHPIPDEQIRQYWVLESKKQENGSTRLTCVGVTALSTPNGKMPMQGPVYCIEAERPILRIGVSSSDKTQFLRNNIHSFEGHYLPGDLSAVQDGKLIFKAHLEAIDEIAEVNESDFTPPANAVLIKKVIAISAGVAQGNLLKHSNPAYPAEAKAAGIQGTIVLQATIDTDGHLSDVSVVSGPPELRQAALDTVSKWLYRPYRLNGEAVSVRTTINIEFHLTR